LGIAIHGKRSAKPGLGSAKHGWESAKCGKGLAKHGKRLTKPGKRPAKHFAALFFYFFMHFCCFDDGIRCFLFTTRLKPY